MKNCTYPGSNPTSFQADKRIIVLTSSAKQQNDCISINLSHYFQLIHRNPAALSSQYFLKTGVLQNTFLRLEFSHVILREKSCRIFSLTRLLQFLACRIDQKQNECEKQQRDNEFRNEVVDDGLPVDRFTPKIAPDIIIGRVTITSS